VILNEDFEEFKFECAVGRMMIVIMSFGNEESQRDSAVQVPKPIFYS